MNTSALVIGAGPAGLMAAETLAQAGVAVIVCDSSPTPARKFLLAGRGGLNLTHSEPLDALLDRYGPARERLEPAIRAFSPEALSAWSEALGEPTFTGSSGRVFPKSFKATKLLRAWLRQLGARGVELRVRHKFMGFGAGGVAFFSTPAGEVSIEAPVTVLALGGASWPRLGGDGAWVNALRDVGVSVAPLRPSNSGFLVDWSQTFRARFAGEPIKAALWWFDGATSRAEAMITSTGIEGGAIYALSAKLRAAVDAEGFALLTVDLKPDVPLDMLARRLDRAPKQSLSTFLRKAVGLTPAAIGLLREAGPIPTEAESLAARVKALPLRIGGVAPIERAISSAGGVRWEAIDADFMAFDRPGTFIAGEMLDWEAPTGGYLLQAAFSTGAAAGRGAARWLQRRTI